MEYVARVLTAAKAFDAATVELKNRFYVGDKLEVLTPAGSHTYVPDSIVVAHTGEQVQTHGVAGTLLKMTFPFSVSEGDIIRGPVRNHAAQDAIGK